MIRGTQLRRCRNGGHLPRSAYLQIPRRGVPWDDPATANDLFRLPSNFEASSTRPGQRSLAERERELAQKEERLAAEYKTWPYGRPGWARGSPERESNA
jgi:hypothetical protein